jgi:hypothetical protein
MKDFGPTHFNSASRGSGKASAAPENSVEVSEKAL